MLEDTFGTWPKAAPYARVPEPLVKKAPTVVTVETPDKANAALFGDLALSINDESSEFGATSVATFLLGEGATSRLWKRIRERDGLSYGVYCVRRLEFLRAQLDAQRACDLRARRIARVSPRRSNEEFSARRA